MFFFVALAIISYWSPPLLHHPLFFSFFFFFYFPPSLAANYLDGKGSEQPGTFLYLFPFFLYVYGARLW